MKNLNTYLTFNGNCREAMTFYGRCLGGEPRIMPFADMPGEKAPGSENLVMHACLTMGEASLMASDTMPGQPVQPGGNFSINVTCDSLDEIERLFAALGEGGTVIMPLADTFWGARFGMLRDRFGIQWMVNFELPKPAKAS